MVGMRVVMVGMRTRMGVGISVGFYGVIAGVGGRGVGFCGRGSGRVGNVAVDGDFCG